MCHKTCPKPVTGGAPIAEAMETVSRDDAEVPVLLAQPEGATGPMSGIVLIHDIWGANDFYHDLARRLASEGYMVALPNLFHREGPLAEETREAALARSASAKQDDHLADLDAVTRWLLEQPNSSGAFGVMGFCLGGTLTFLRAAREPIPAAGVAFYGFPARESTANAPIRPLDEPEVAAVAAPLLGLWGDQDSGVGMDNVKAYEEALDRHGKEHEFIIYPGASHAFLTFDPNAPTYETSRKAWDHALAFLAKHLRTSNIA
ncbi:MAG TPA: dienelactone hydrolase family protein [Thermomicrobiales bacterium]|nr:dienelactone hydrolase family protein [Thermomicrobiales bacterium]